MSQFKKGIAISLLCFVAVSGKDSARGSTTPQPLVIQIAYEKSTMLIFLNNKQVALDIVKESLLESQRRFGGGDPVIILFGANVPVGLLLEVSELSKRTHSEVHLLLMKTADLADAELSFKCFSIFEESAFSMIPQPYIPKWLRPSAL